MVKFLFLSLIGLWTLNAFSHTKFRDPVISQKDEIDAMFGPFKTRLKQIKISSQIVQSNPENINQQIKSEIFLRDITVAVGSVEISNTMVPGLKSKCRNILIDLRGHPELYVKLLVNTEFKSPTNIELNIEDIQLHLATDYIAENSVGVCTGLFNLRDPLLERILNHALKKGMTGFNILGNIIVDHLDNKKISP